MNRLARCVRRRWNNIIHSIQNKNIAAVLFLCSVIILAVNIEAWSTYVANKKTRVACASACSLRKHERTGQVANGEQLLYNIPACNTTRTHGKNLGGGCRGDPPPMNAAAAHLTNLIERVQLAAPCRPEKRPSAARTDHKRPIHSSAWRLRLRLLVLRRIQPPPNAHLNCRRRCLHHLASSPTRSLTQVGRQAMACRCSQQEALVTETRACMNASDVSSFSSNHPPLLVSFQSFFLLN